MLTTFTEPLRNTTRSRLKQLSAQIDVGLPPQMRPALEYLITGRRDPAATEVGTRAENRRKQIASGGQSRLPIWYSPKPGSAGDDPDGRPAPGKELEFTMKRIAATGKDRRWGTALYPIAREFESTAGLELGACAGISAIYLSSAPQMKSLITVEGSAPLAGLAAESLQPFSHARVVNALFDDAIDAELPGVKLDLAYIDGHHEKVATIHYFNKIRPYLQPGAVVIFDDVSWSRDMREAWQYLSAQPEFAHAMDLGEIGVCLLADSPSAPRYWDLQAIAGRSRHRIGDPAGWKE